jgi:hypothetical protein
VRARDDPVNDDSRLSCGPIGIDVGKRGERGGVPSVDTFADADADARYENTLRTPLMSPRIVSYHIA